jgi:hypothetical protein
MYCLLKFFKFHVCFFTNSKQGLKLEIVGVRKVIFTFLCPTLEFLLVCMLPNGHSALWHGVSNLITNSVRGRIVLCLLLLAEGQIDSSKLVTGSGCRGDAVTPQKEEMKSLRLMYISQWLSLQWLVITEYVAKAHIQPRIPLLLKVWWKQCAPSSQQNYFYTLHDFRLLPQCKWISCLLGYYAV